MVERQRERARREERDSGIESRNSGNNEANFFGGKSESAGKQVIRPLLSCSHNPLQSSARFVNESLQTTSRYFLISFKHVEHPFHLSTVSRDPRNKDLQALLGQIAAEGKQTEQEEPVIACERMRRRPTFEEYRKEGVDLDQSAPRKRKQ